MLLSGISLGKETVNPYQARDGHYVQSVIGPELRDAQSTDNDADISRHRERLAA